MKRKYEYVELQNQKAVLRATRRCLAREYLQSRGMQWLQLEDWQLEQIGKSIQEGTVG